VVSPKDGGRGTDDGDGSGRLTLADQELPFGAFGIGQRIIGLDHGHGMNATPVSSHRGIPWRRRKDAVDYIHCQLDQHAPETATDMPSSAMGGLYVQHDVGVGRSRRYKDQSRITAAG
jgi:hypothetical protein